jgi:hypothetical protein
MIENILKASQFVLDISSRLTLQVQTGSFWPFKQTFTMSYRAAAAKAAAGTVGSSSGNS